MPFPYGQEAQNQFAQTMKAFRNQLSMYSGQQNHYVVNVASADVDLTTVEEGKWLNCRYATVDTTGIIKYDYKGDNGKSRTEVKVAVAGTIIQVPNIVKVYRYYIETTSCTAEVYTDAGVSVVGIKLCF